MTRVILISRHNAKPTLVPYTSYHDLITTVAELYGLQGYENRISFETTMSGILCDVAPITIDQNVLPEGVVLNVIAPNLPWTFQPPTELYQPLNQHFEGLDHIYDRPPASPQPSDSSGEFSGRRFSNATTSSVEMHLRPHKSASNSPRNSPANSPASFERERFQTKRAESLPPIRVTSPRNLPSVYRSPPVASHSPVLRFAEQQQRSVSPQPKVIIPDYISQERHHNARSQSFDDSTPQSRKRTASKSLKSVKSVANLGGGSPQKQEAFEFGEELARSLRRHKSTINPNSFYTFPDGELPLRRMGLGISRPDSPISPPHTGYPDHQYAQ